MLRDEYLDIINHFSFRKYDWSSARGQIAAHAGFQYVFLSTSSLLFIACIWVYFHNKNEEVSEKRHLEVS